MLSLSYSHPQESSIESFFLCWFLAPSSVEDQRYIFLDPQRGYVTVYWSRIRVLSSPSEGRPLAAVIINDCWIPIVGRTLWFLLTPALTELVAGTHLVELIWWNFLQNLLVVLIPRYLFCGTSSAELIWWNLFCRTCCWYSFCGTSSAELIWWNLFCRTCCWYSFCGTFSAELVAGTHSAVPLLRYLLCRTHLVELSAELVGGTHSAVPLLRYLFCGTHLVELSAELVGSTYSAVPLLRYLFCGTHLVELSAELVGSTHSAVPHLRYLSCRTHWWNLFCGTCCWYSFCGTSAELIW